MKNKDVLKLQIGLMKLGNLKGAKFAFLIARTLRTVNEYIEDMQISIKHSDDYGCYERERIQLCNTHSKKDEDGVVITKGGAFVIDDRNAFDVAYGVLAEKHKELIDDYDKAVKDYEKLLEDESGIELQKIDFDNIPDEISCSQFEAIFSVIKD